MRALLLLAATATCVFSQTAQLSVMKQAPPSAFAGADLNYSFQIANFGPSTAANVTFSDSLPPFTTFVSFTPPTGFSCTTPAVGAAGTITCTKAAFTVADGFLNFFLTVHVSALHPGGTVDNTATISSTTTEVDPSDNSSTTNTSISVPETDLTLVKSGPATVDAGAEITYTTTVTNAALADVAGVTVSDATPAGLTFVSNTGACVTAFPCNLGVVLAGQSVVITSKYTVAPAIAAGTVISNTALVTSPAGESNDSNNDSTASTTVTVSSDVSVVKSGSSTVNAGSNITYTITVANAGPSTATGVSLADLTPPNTSFVSNSGGCTTAFPCSIGTLAPGASAVITSVFSVAGNVGGGTVISNTATVSSTSSDPSPGNNSSSKSTTVAASTDLSITKNAVGSAIAGSNFSYTIVVANAGPSTATGVSVADSTPPGLTFVSNTGGCTTAFPCALGTLASGASATITSTYTIGAGTPNGTVISNTATVSSTTTDPNPGNNTSTANSTVGASADVSITKNAVGSAVAGGNFSYTIVVANAGPSTATGVSVADSTPPGLTFVSNSGGCATAFPCSLGSLASGASATITSTYTVGAATPDGTVISNTATVSTTATDSNPGNNVSTATSTVGVSANLSITKTGPPAANPNTDITYTITVNNAGPGSATSVAVTDALPAGTVFVSATPSQGTCSGTTTVTCSLGTVANAGSATISLKVHVNAGMTGALANTATVSSVVTDPSPANNTSTANTAISPASIPVVSPFAMLALIVALGALGAIPMRPEQAARG